MDARVDNLMRLGLAGGLALAFSGFSGLASAQAEPPAPTAQPAPPPAPAPPYAQPYGYPPPYPPYPPPYPYPPYAYPVPYQQPAPPPKSLPYEGGRVPEGYHVDESVRRGPAIGGAITFGVAYMMGITAASSYSFSNQSGWLALPLAGPFITMWTRENRCLSSSDTSSYPSTPCEDDKATVRMLLVLDGMAQVTGVALFAWGMSTTSKRLVRNDVTRLVVAPTRVGSGYGLGALGSF